MKRILSAAVVSLHGLSLAEAGEVKISEFTFEVQEPWSDVSSGKPMRAAELQFDAEGEEDPVAVFYFFGAGQGGGIEANVARWKGQFQGELTSEKSEELPGGGIMLVLEGTYLESMGGPFAGPKTPKPDHAMLAAILPSEKGNVYVKLTAPKAVAAQAKEPLKKLVLSALPKDE